MLTWLAELSPYFSPLNIFRYITFRTAGAVVTAQPDHQVAGRPVPPTAAVQIQVEPERHRLRRVLPRHGRPGTGALRHEILEILDAANLTGQFSVIVASGDTPESKPSPAPYRLAFERLLESRPDLRANVRFLAFLVPSTSGHAALAMPSAPQAMPSESSESSIVSVPPVSCQSSSLPPPKGSAGLGPASGLSLFVNSMRYTTSSLRLVPFATWNS